MTHDISPAVNHPVVRMVLPAIAIAAACQFSWAQDEDDHGDTTDAATTVTVGSSTSGTLTAGDDDYFRVELAEGDTLTFYTEGGTDTRGTLTSEDGNVSQDDDDLGEKLNFHIERELAAGTFFVRVRGFDETTTGDYTFRVSSDDIAGDDHGDKRQSATRVDLPSSSTAGTLTGGDHDYFRVELAEANTLTVYTEGRIDTYGSLMNEDGNVIWSNDDSGPGSNFRIVRTLEAGTYFVQVRGYRSWTTGDYTFRASTPTAPTAAPGNVEVVAGVGALTVSWTRVADADNGGSAITGYTATASSGDEDASAECTAAANGTTCTIDGLAAGTTFDVTVHARNAVGSGPASEPVTATTPTAPTAAPTNVEVAVGAGVVTASWDAVAEADDGGSPITGYTATATPPDDGTSAECTASATETTCTIDGLAAGTTFDVTVRADNAVGAGPASDPVQATTPTVPAAPGNVAVTPGLRHLAVTWDAVPVADNGGSPITGYVSTATPDEGDATTCTTDAQGTGCTIESLSPGTTYSVTVYAVNAVGNGTASAPLETSTLPPTPPTAAPANVQVTPGVGRLAVAWEGVAVPDDGGSPIIGYAASAATADGNSSGTCSTDAATLDCTIGGLVPGLVHAVTVHATNALGDGVASEAIDAAPKSRSYRFIGEQADDGAGWSLAAVPSEDGGQADLLIGAPFHDVGERESGGAAYILAAADLVRADAADGLEDGTVRLRNVAAQPNSWKFVGETAGDSAGWGIAPLAGLDADGATDLAVGAPQRVEGGASSGAAYLVASTGFAAADEADGSVDGVVDLGLAVSQANSWKVLGGVAQQLGTTLIDAGDVGGDGRDELLLHAKPGDRRGATGSAILISLADLAAADRADDTEDGVILSRHVAAQSNSWEFVGTGIGGTSGRGLAAAGDVDGDGRAELLLGVPHHAPPDGVASGAAYVAGAADLTAADANSDGVVDVADLAGQPASWQMLGENPFDLAGQSVASADDIDGDGLADLIVGAPHHSYRGDVAGGAAYLAAAANLAAADAADAATDGSIELGRVADQSASWKFVGDNPSDEAGVLLASAGDVDGDGLADLLIGTDADATYLIATHDLPAADAADGVADGVIDVANVAVQPNSWKLIGDAQLFGTGISLVSVGDVDGDGLPDVAIGASRNHEGAVFLVTAETLARVDAQDGDADGVVTLGRIANPKAEDVFETRELEIHLAGTGTVAFSNGGSISCAVPNRCSSMIPTGTLITVQAVPGDGYRLAGWRRCDTVEEDLCTVTVDENRTISVDFVSATPLGFRDNVVYLDSDRFDSVLDFDPETGVIRIASGGETADIVPGSVVIADEAPEDHDFPTSFARKVNAVHVEQGAPTFVETTPVGLADVFSGGTLRVEGALNTQNATSYILPPGVQPADYSLSDLSYLPPVVLDDGRIEYRLARMPDGSTGLDPTDLQPDDYYCPELSVDLSKLRGLPKDLEIRGSLEVCMDFDIYVDFKARTDEDDRGWRDINQARLRLFLKVTPGLGVTISKELDWNKEIKLPIEIPMGAIPIPPTPIVVIPTLSFDLIVDAWAKGSIGLTAEGVLEAEAGLDWIPLWNLEPVLELDRSFDLSRTAGVSTGLDLFVRGNVNMHVMGISPFVGAGPYMNFELRSETPCGDEALGFVPDGSLGIRGTGGFRLFRWLSNDVSIGARLYSLPLENPCEVAKDESPPPVPGGLTFEGNKESIGYLLRTYDPGDAITLRWDPVNDGEGNKVAYRVEVEDDDNGWRTVGRCATKLGETCTTTADTSITVNNARPPADGRDVRKYSFQVFAVDAVGNQSESIGVVSAWVESLDEVPPESPSVSTLQSGSRWIRLTWSKPYDGGRRRPGAPQLTYELGHSMGDETEYQIQDEAGTTDLYGSVRHLSPGTEYCFAVRALDERRNVSEWSGERCASTLPDGQEEWRFRVRCEGQVEYAIEDGFDIPPDALSMWSTGTFLDYDGDSLRYEYRIGRDDADATLWSGYVEVLDGEGEATLRRDTFDATLTRDDTGDIEAIPEVSNESCKAFVRFDRPAATEAGVFATARGERRGQDSRRPFKPSEVFTR